MSESGFDSQPQTKDSVIKLLRQLLPGNPYLDTIIRFTEEAYKSDRFSITPVDCFEAVANILEKDPQDIAEIANSGSGSFTPELLDLVALMGMDEPDQTIPDAVHVGLVVDPDNGLVWSKLGVRGRIEILSLDELYKILPIERAGDPKYFDVGLHP